MDDGLDYHLQEGDGTVLSLQFANPSREIVEQELASHREGIPPQVDEFHSRITTKQFDQEIYALYAAEVYPHTFSGYRDDFEGENRRIADTVVDAFRIVEDEYHQAGRELKWYKEPNLDDVVQAVNQTEWCQRIPNVAGCLLSNLITTHGLPNANHRTALSFVQVYLQTYAGEFEIPDTGVTGEWYDWASEFVYESKRLLTLSRKAQLFRYLDRWGCPGVVRKNDTAIPFETYPIDVEDPFTHFREQHRKLSKEFIYQILERVDENSVIGKEDQGRSAFLDRLTATQ